MLTIPPNSTDQTEYQVECIPAGGLKGEINIAIILRAVNVVQEVALAEIEDGIGYKLLPDYWKYIRAKISKISQGVSQNSDGKFEPFISSKIRPGSDCICAAALLEAIRTGTIKPK